LNITAVPFKSRWPWPVSATRAELARVSLQIRRRKARSPSTRPHRAMRRRHRTYAARHRRRRQLCLRQRHDEICKRGSVDVGRRQRVAKQVTAASIVASIVSTSMTRLGDAYWPD
jgi:hypothetical protein